MIHTSETYAHAERGVVIQVGRVFTARALIFAVLVILVVILVLRCLFNLPKDDFAIVALALARCATRLDCNTRSAR